MLVLLLGSLAAHAHPNALRIVAHRAAVHVTESHVEVRYAVELPGHAHTGTREPADDAQTLTETISGLTASGDGTSLPLEVTQAEGPTLNTNGAARTTLVLEAPHNAVHLQFEDGNYPELPGYFASSFTIGPGLDVVSCSLFKVDDEGSPVASREERWQAGGDHRLVDIRVAKRTAPLTQAFDALHPMPLERTAWQARVPTWRDAWRTPTPMLWLATLVAALFVGSAHRRPEPRSIVWMAVGAGVASVLTLLGPVLATSVAVASMAVAATQQGQRPHWLALVATWPLAGIASAQLLVPALIVAIVVAVVAGEQAVRARWLVLLAVLCWLRAAAAAIT
ncbi:MAG: hypothetical protein KC912_04555 [Proteobacteria bacterium]|nr:hypothetical protein [Pseudomonadota bacterium]